MNKPIYALKQCKCGTFNEMLPKDHVKSLDVLIQFQCANPECGSTLTICEQFVQDQLLGNAWASRWAEGYYDVKRLTTRS